MGVMSCDRLGCDAVMCDKYSEKYGYICTACYYELQNSDASIREFMNTEREDIALSIDEEFRDV